MIMRVFFGICFICLISVGFQCYKVQGKGESTLKSMRYVSKTVSKNGSLDMQRSSNYDAAQKRELHMLVELMFVYIARIYCRSLTKTILPLRLDGITLL